jgi:hypothetical protein
MQQPFDHPTMGMRTICFTSHALDLIMTAQILEALEIGLDAARDVAMQYHLAYKGYRPEGHQAVDDDVRKIEAAIALYKSQKSAAKAPSHSHE